MGEGLALENVGGFSANKIFGSIFSFHVFVVWRVGGGKCAPQPPVDAFYPVLELRY